jgi:uncharacterized protein YbaP (TraB family)
MRFRPQRYLGAVLAGLLLTPTFSAAAECPPVQALPTAEQVAAANAAAMRDHGLLWRIRRGGHASYLYGTLHVGRLAWATPGPAVRAAWGATDVLALELDISDPQTLKALTQAPPLARPLSAAMQDRLAAQARAACIPETALAALHPLMQVSTLAMLAGRWDDLDSAYAQEAVLLGLAHSEGRKIVALESPQQQLAALIPKDPKEVLQGIDEGLEQLEHNEVRAPMLKLALAWAHSDLAVLQSYEQWCDCIHSETDRRYMRGMLEARNPPMAERLAALHASGKRVFVAVGALHMTGPAGLPRLLKQMGFEVQRLVPAE